VCPYVRERDTVKNLEFDEEGETYGEELLQAEQEEQTPASAKNEFKSKINL